jgi:tetratricopeptide (TPR) repeat protein
MKRAIELDPLSPVYNTSLGFTFYQARQYGRALEQYNRTLVLQPDFFITHGQLALLYAQTGQYPNAISEITKFRALIAARSNNEIAADGVALKKAFAAQKALGFWQEIQRQRPRDAAPFQETQMYIGLGDIDMALDSLQLDYEQRDFFMIFLGVDPIFDSLRPDSRFKSVIRQIGLMQ